MIVLCGKSGSGKSTVQNALVDMGLSRIVTYTTRPQRPCEENGVAYHFITEEEFWEKVKSKVAMEFTSYTVETGDIWFYATEFKDFNVNGVVILSPHGIKNLTPEMIEKYKIMVCYLECSPEVLYQRLVNRGDKIEEVDRRLKADGQDFSDIESLVTLTVHCDTFSSAKAIAFTLIGAHDKFLKLKEKHEKI